MNCSCKLILFCNTCHLVGEGPTLHLLKAKGQHTVCLSTPHQVAGHEECSGASGAVVVNIVDGDASHAHLIESPLATCGVPCVA